MKIAAKIIIAICSILMSTFWIMWVVFPEFAKDFFEVSADSITGINSLKSDMGGFVLTAGIFMVLSLFNTQRWIYSALIVTVAILINRIISLITDGLSTQAIGATVFEVLVLIACIILTNNKNIKK